MDPSSQDGLREALAGLLRPADGGPPTADDLADVLWIARLAGLDPLPGPDGGPPVPTDDDRPRPPSAADTAPSLLPAPAPPHPAGSDPAAPAGTPSSDARAALHTRGGPPGPGGHGAPGGHAVQVAQPPALDGPLALARALRPLRRLVDAPGRLGLDLDEEATAEATAETGIRIPVRRPVRRPRFSVDLLVDVGATMAVWHRLGGELATLLERHGAFADVRCWALGTDGEEPTLAPFHRRRSAEAAVPRTGWSRPLDDPTGRRILLVLTDGVGPAWYGPTLPAFLAKAAATRPAAALQVLPRRLWHRTALRTAPVEARASGAGRPVPAFRSEAALPGVPRGARGAAERSRVRWLPVLEVDADWLAPWVGLTAGRTSGWTPMLAAPLGGVPRPQRPAGPAEDPAAPAERVARFRAGSSPTAYRLACHLSAAPLSLPVMRLVQRATVPESGQTDLAELFVSGLLRARGEAAEDPDEQVYDFRPGVREELLAELTRTESVHVLAHVLAKVSGRVAATFGGTLDFRALATVGGDGAPLPEQSLPFAEVALAVLAGAGGRYTEVAGQLAGAVGRTPGGGAGGVPVVPAVRLDLLEPVPPIQSPPDPPVMIGRRRELAALEAAFALTRPATEPERPAVVILTGARGMGRRRIVQEYVRAHDGRHPFVHWIDARRPGSLELRLGRLWNAVSPNGALFDESSLDGLWEQLARHQDWLVVLDGVPRGAWVGRARLPFFVPTSGRGCVIVTTEAVGTWRHPEAVIVPVRALDEEEVFEELTGRLGQARDPDDLRQEQALRRLARRLPRVPGQLAARNLDADVASALADAVAAPDTWNSIIGGTVHGSVVQAGTVDLHLPPRIPMAPLPARSGAFTGREEEIAELTGFLTPVEPGARPNRTALVSGLPGVGKSELVLHAAALAVERGWYPGGVLYLDLAGNRAGAPLTAEQLMNSLVRALGVVPEDHQDRTTLYRSSLAAVARENGPVLLVLDNAASAAQVEPLLPADGPITALVSSRTTLSLEARLFDVGVLSAEESVALLANRLRARRGDDRRLTDAPDLARALAELCGGLPLALTICADLLADSPTRPLASLVERLSDPHVRLDRLSRSDRSLRAALDASYAQLPDDQARLFRLLSVFPHSDLTTEAAACLADLDVQLTEDLLSELALTHLVDAAPSWGRWSVHPLVTLYAISLRTRDTNEHADATRRLLTHYGSTTENAADYLDQGKSAARFRSSEQVLAWLEAERAVLIPLVRYTAFHDSVDAALTFATPLVSLLIRTRRFEDLATVVDTMLDLFRRDDDGGSELWFMEYLRLKLDSNHPRPGDRVPEHQRAAFERLVRLIADMWATNPLHLAVHVAGADAEDERAAVAEILLDLADDPTVNAEVTFPGTDLRLTITGAPDPLAAVGTVITKLWGRPRAQRTLDLAMYAGLDHDQVPWGWELGVRLNRAPAGPSTPLTSLVVSMTVLEMVRARLGKAVTTDFTPVRSFGPGQHTNEDAYLYTGNIRALFRRLTHPAAERADGP
ncbi:SAV_2336 N-terminal domain-related protein [Kitasatospora sp. NPDC056184]|uniref:SAV_2336 N-terminal domain-related protein n=1 Tax=Kitasatospora sp. NPDC056184 TaxID=3345738 RepID=UPI0035D9BE63